MIYFRRIALLLSVIVLFSCAEQTLQNSDPLPSWNNGKTKQSILNFVNDVTTKSNPNFVKPEDRIAAFDNDGTLWSEQPYYFQFQFAIDRIKILAGQHPEWKSTQPFKAVLENDTKTLLTFGVHGMLEIVMASHAGMTTEEFVQIVREWIDMARHPGNNKLYKEMVFQPMLEVLDFLRANGFKTYIVSGGGLEFMRPWTEEVYGIPPEQVIGSSIKTKFELKEGKAVLMRLAELDIINDKEEKPVNIEKFIGKRPVIAFGNSDGDLQMLQWTDAGSGRRLMVYIHHTDAEREWAYDRESPVGRLNRGLDEADEKGWTVVDMKNDWNKVYPDSVR